MKHSALATLIAGVLALLAASPVLGGTRSCTAGMVTLGICRTTADVAYCLPIGTVDPDGAGPLAAPSQLILDAFATVGNYQSPSACTAEMVTAGICTGPQVGTLVTVTKAQFADLMVRRYILEVIKRYRTKLNLDAAQASSDAEAAPDIGN